ncbi:17660_t:CDS:2, partial [Gigaspora rosea]
KQYDDNITNNMLALLIVKSEDEINRLFDKIQEVENLAGHNIWKLSPNNTNIVEATHALSNRHGKSLKLMSAILQGHKLDKEKFTAIRIHQQYNVPNHGQDKGSISRNILSNKHK